MNEGTLKASLTGGDPRSLHGVDDVVESVIADPSRLPELIELVFTADQVVRMRAADALEKVARDQPRLLTSRVHELLDRSEGSTLASVQWHVAQIVGEVPLEPADRPRAIARLREYLDGSDDWIVINNSLTSLMALGHADSAVRPYLDAQIARFERSDRTAVAKRARLLRRTLAGQATALR